MTELLESVPREVLLIVWSMAAGHLIAYVITMLIGVIQRDTSTALGREIDREYRWIVRGTILWPIALPYLAARACWRWWRGRWKARKNLRQAKHGLVYMQPDGTVSPASLSGEAAAERLCLCERNLEYVQGRSLPSGARQHARQMLDAAKAEYDAAFPHVPYASKPPSGTGSAPEAPREPDGPPIDIEQYDWWLARVEETTSLVSRGLDADGAEKRYRRIRPASIVVRIDEGDRVREYVLVRRIDSNPPKTL